MVYIQLSESIKGYNKVRIKQLNYFDNINIKAGKNISFKYGVFREVGGEEKFLYEKFVDVVDRDFIENVFEKEDFSHLNAFDSLCRILLNYLIQNGYETGTLEVR